MGPIRHETKHPLRLFVGWRLDLALAVRMLARHPALSAIAVFGITVAIAIAATMFTIIGEQLSPSALPLPAGDRVVALQKWDSVRSRPEPIRPQDVRDWQEQLSAVRDIGAFRTVTKNLIVPPAAPEPVHIAEMSAAGFAVAGVAPMLGRVLHPEDERPDAAPAVVIGYGEWRRRFGGNPHVLGATVQLGDAHHTVVGVMPDGFAFPVHHAFWIPLRLDIAVPPPAAGGPPLSAFGRLATRATLQSAGTEIAAVDDGARHARPADDHAIRSRVVSYAHQFSEIEQPGNRLALQVARFFIAILLVVVTINVAVLVYARTAARQGEIAVRTALGASRGRIVWQLFGEGLVLAAFGAVAGVGLSAVALARIREAFAQQDPLPFWFRFEISGATILYVVGLSLAAAAIIGALPGWKATGSRVQNRLQTLTGGGHGGMQLGRVWTALIVLQVACAVALLPMVVVRMSELAREGTQGFGFAAHEYVVAQLSMEGTPAGTDTRAGLASGYSDMEGRITRSGTVRASTFSSFAPGFEAFASIRTGIDGPDATVRVNHVSHDFFETLQVPVLTGRDFVSADAASDARAVIVNRAFANLANGAVGLGSLIRPATGAQAGAATTGLADDWYQVVGIVADFPAPPSGTATATATPILYTAITPDAVDALTLTLHLRTGDTEPWGTRLREMAAEVDPRLQVMNVMRMDDLLAQHQRPARLLAAVFAAMTLSVLLLSAAGIYAMTAFSVTQRRREIGIRLALGAGARRILWTMFSRAGAQLLAGAALGAGVALLLVRAAGGEQTSGAAMATAGVVLLMTVVGLLAALGPARQGLRIQPTEALRDPSR